MENFWEQHAQDFEKLNDYVVGVEDMRLVKEKIAEIKNLNNCLELACGNGTYTKIIAKNATNVLATDLSSQMLHIAKQNLKGFKNIDFKEVDCLNLPFEGEKFDTIFMANLLHVTDDAHKTLQEARRILKPNGKIYALDFTLFGMSESEQEKMKKRFMESYGIRTNKPQYPTLNPQSLKEIFQKESFEVIKSELIGDKSKAVFIKGKKT